MCDSHDDLPTARTTVRHAALQAFCKSCGHAAEVDLKRLIAAGKGDVPLIHLKLRCTACGGRNCDSVVSGRDWRDQQAP